MRSAFTDPAAPIVFGVWLVAGWIAINAWAFLNGDATTLRAADLPLIALAGIGSLVIVVGLPFHVFTRSQIPSPIPTIIPRLHAVSIGFIRSKIIYRTGVILFIGAVFLSTGLVSGESMPYEGAQLIAATFLLFITLSRLAQPNTSLKAETGRILCALIFVAGRFIVDDIARRNGFGNDGEHILFSLFTVCAAAWALLTPRFHISPRASFIGSMALIAAAPLTLYYQWANSQPAFRGAMALWLMAGALLLSPVNVISAWRVRARYPDINRRIYYPGMLVIGIIYVGLSLIAADNAQGALNPDGAAYFQIAREYAAGRFPIREYWSPLISWLIAPFVRLGAEPGAAFQGLSLFIGAAVVVMSVMLAERFGIDRRMRLILAYGMAIFAVGHVFTPITPDYLGALILAIYFYAMTDPNLRTQPIRFGVIGGVLGALAYFAKFYNLPFAAAHLVLTSLLLIGVGAHRRRAAIFLGTSLATLLLVSAPWIAAISVRTGSLTITTSAPLNQALIGSGAVSIETQFPCVFTRLCPTAPDVLFPWQSPQPDTFGRLAPTFVPPADAPPRWVELLRNARANLVRWGRVFSQQLGIFVIMSLFAGGASVLIARGSSENRRRRTWVVGTIFLYCVGYFLFYAGELRYFYAIVPLIGIVFLMQMQRVVARTTQMIADPTRRKIHVGVMTGALFAIFTLFVPLASMQRVLTSRFSQCFVSDARALSPHLVAPWASEDVNNTGIAYYAQVQTYGIVPSTRPPEQADAELRAAGVKSYLLRSAAPLAEALPRLFGYSVRATVTFCGEAFTVLDVP